MGKTFVCSLCRNGIIGGGLYIDEQSITYSTQKLTVSPLYRNLVLPMNEIKGAFMESDGRSCCSNFHERWRML